LLSILPCASAVTHSQTVTDELLAQLAQANNRKPPKMNLMAYR